VSAHEARVRKLADRIRVIVAETLEMRVKDPRLGFVTITDVRVTGDLREATVFYTVYGDDEARADTAAALDSARGVLRTEVGRQTGVRHTPSLDFVADALPDNARHDQVSVPREGSTLVGVKKVQRCHAGSIATWREEIQRLLHRRGRTSAAPVAPRRTRCAARR